mgnify:CR=1 FL=1
MIYIIDSSVNTSNSKISKVKDFFDRYDIEYEYITTAKYSKHHFQFFKSKLPESLVQKIVYAMDFDLKRICKNPFCTAVTVLKGRDSEGVNFLRTGQAYELPLSKFITWISEHPHFLANNIIYDEKSDRVVTRFTDDEYHSFIPRKFREVQIREAQIIALGSLSLSVDEEL